MYGAIGSWRLRRGGKEMFRLEDGRYIIDFNDGYPLGKMANYVFDNGVHVIGSVEPTLKRNIE